MPIIRADQYETPEGIALTNTAWYLTGLGVDVVQMTASAVIYGYVSPAAYAAGKQPVGQRRLTVGPADFAAFILTPQPAGSLSDTLGRVAYEYALANDEFFEGATIQL